MYKVDEISREFPSYYSLRELYHRSSNKRGNLQFRIYDNLEDSYFVYLNGGDKSIIYDYTHFVLDEFQLQDLSDKHLWSIMVIIEKALKKKYSNEIHVVLSEAFKGIEKYLKGEKINYERLGKYCKSNDHSQFWQS